jgi:tRNA threonylcarbamoyladenosine biosynthesis protein TsaB
MTLGLSTSLGEIRIVISNNQEVLFLANEKVSLDNNMTLGELVENGLEQANTTVQDLTEIVVDTGPGGTSSVRTGVAFANGLSYSLDIPVIPVTSLELICVDVFNTYKSHSVTLIKSIKSNVYAGIYDGNKMETYHGSLENLAARLKSLDGSIHLAGYGPSRIALRQLLGGPESLDSDISRVDPHFLVKYRDLFEGRQVKFPSLPIPLTETNVLINE